MLSVGVEGERLNLVICCLELVVENSSNLGMMHLLQYLLRGFHIVVMLCPLPETVPKRRAMANFPALQLPEADVKGPFSCRGTYFDENPHRLYACSSS